MSFFSNMPGYDIMAVRSHNITALASIIEGNEGIAEILGVTPGRISQLKLACPDASADKICRHFEWDYRTMDLPGGVLALYFMLTAGYYDEDIRDVFNKAQSQLQSLHEYDLKVATRKQPPFNYCIRLLLKERLPETES